MIKVIDCHWVIEGDLFSPNKAETQGNITFDTKHEVGDVSPRFPDKTYNYGYATLSQDENDSYWPLSSEDVLASTIERIAPILYKCGAEKIIMVCTFEYDTQCNFEFEMEELARLVSIGAKLAITCYQGEPSET